MKILSVVLSTAALAAMAGPPAPAGAAPEDAAAISATALRQVVVPDDDCTGAQVVDAVYLRRFGGSPVMGRIRVRKDSCSRYWAEVSMYRRIPANAIATAYLTRYAADGTVTRWSCADGGTKPVVTGQTICRSPKILATGQNTTFVASAVEWHDGGGGYARVSWGQTGRTR